MKTAWRKLLNTGSKMTKGLVLAILVLSSLFPAHGSDHPFFDLWGNAYPPRCRNAPDPPDIIYKVAPLGHTADGAKRLGGYWIPGLRGQWPLVIIDDSIRDKETQLQVMLHERCHHIMWFYTGNPNWH